MTTLRGLRNSATGSENVGSILNASFRDLTNDIDCTQLLQQRHLTESKFEDGSVTGDFEGTRHYLA